MKRSDGAKAWSTVLSELAQVRVSVEWERPTWRGLSRVLDTDDGRGDRHQGVRRGWWDPADDLHHHRAEEPGGADERQVAALWRLLVHRRGDGSVFVGAFLTAAVENSLSATRIDLATRCRTI
jgi:hypothetical protein